MDDYQIDDRRGLCDFYGVDPDAEDWQKQLDRAVYDETECGARVFFNEMGTSVELHTIVEGSEAEVSRTLWFPFLASTWRGTVEHVETLADALWKEANGEAEPGSAVALAIWDACREAFGDD